MALTADKVIGNRIKVHKNVMLEIGHPGSGNFELLNAGRLTPPIYSYVERNGTVYWVFGELGISYYLPHDSSFEIIADSGGAQYLQPPKASALDVFNNFGKTLIDTQTALKKVAIGTAIIGGGMLLLKAYQASKMLDAHDK